MSPVPAQPTPANNAPLRAGVPGAGAGETAKYLLSPALYAKVTGGAVFRKGVWGENKNPPTKWQIYPTITQPVHAASDHAAIYADIDL